MGKFAPLVRCRGRGGQCGALVDGDRKQLCNDCQQERQEREAKRAKRQGPEALRKQAA